VLFMQGCALQCQYCHNPDTWDTGGGRHVTVEDILAEIEPYLPYYRKSGGGITVTGGEPTLQAPFIAQLFEACKSRYGLHTAIDSSGFCEPEHARELLSYTDLVLLDLKLMERHKHTALTSQPNDRILRFARFLQQLNKPVWIRHVLVPGVTDAALDLQALGTFLGEWGSIEKFELLPYHRMGVYKWEQLGRVYPLEGVKTPTEQELARAVQIIEAARTSASFSAKA